MKQFTLPELLTDSSRLHEIHKLRTAAWADLPSPTPIDDETFPDGFADPLDEKGIHWISTDTDGKLIAAARVAILNDLRELPYPRIFEKFRLPQSRPFLLYSHRCTLPEYRDVIPLRTAFDAVRLRFHREKRIPFGIATAYTHRHLALPLFGWKRLGRIDNADDPNFYFGHDQALVLMLEDLQLPDEP